MKKFKNSKGANKEIARLLMVEAIKNSRTTKGEILSLPFETCEIEEKIFKTVSKNYTYFGVEVDTDVYYRMLQTIAKKSLPFVQVANKEIGEVIVKAKENQYSHVILDYCGQLNTFALDIEMALKNKIVEVDGTICITLNDRISGSFATVKRMERICKRKSGQTRTENALQTLINVYGGLNYDVEQIFKYRDGDGKGSNMLLAIVRRVA